MRNLLLQYCKEIKTNVENVKQLVLNTNGARNEQLAYLITDTNLYGCGVDGNKPVKVVELFGIVSAEYLVLENVVCLATGVGEVLLVDPHTQTITEGTYCDVGIECMEWSPDQEVVVFITKIHQVVVMTCNFEPLAEHVLEEECDGDSQFVNVGWGKKETQFHGSAGKHTAKDKEEFKQPGNVQQLPQNTTICWRGDGNYFAVSFVSDKFGRMFKVFNREGKVMYISEKINKLQPAIAWRPSGTWLAVPQLLPNKSVMALFERNGLRHGEFVLPFDLQEEQIESIKWSPDSDILSFLTKTEKEQRIYLYTIGNYHWYLKQVLVYGLDDHITCYIWDKRSVEEKILHVLLKNGKQLSYRWHFNVVRCEGVVAVIDGKRLLLTDFSKAVIPPPYCSDELLLDNFINECVFYVNNADRLLELWIYTANYDLHFYYTELKTSTKFTQMLQFKPEGDLGNIRLSNINFINIKYILATHSVGGNTRILYLSIVDGTAGYHVHSALSINGTVNALTVGSSGVDEFYVQCMSDAKSYQISVKPDSTLKLERCYSQLAHPADHIQWYTLADYCKVGLISLCTNQSLYLDSHRIADDVTSFCVAGKFLVYTQLNELHFVSLDTLQHVDRRAVERGAKLVTIVNNEARVVMQQPRGNLETIRPRILMLDLVAAFLQCQRYQIAFSILRKNRINLNIICDHNMQKFVDSIDIFLKDLNQPNWLNLFINDLQNEDFTQTMYAANYIGKTRQYPEGFSIERKVIYICELLHREMLKLDVVRFQLPLLATDVKLGHLEQALQRVWQQKQELQNQDVNTTNTISQQASAMFQFLLYMVDVNELYKVALGTYEFGLIMFVAQKSQKDPKEYLPFLNELKKLEQHYRQFKIDEHLKRNTRALENIAQCGSERHAEALKFIKQHQLYQRALEFYRTQPEFYQQICLAYADELRGNARLAQASVMYERGGQLTQALLSAKHVLDWQRALYLARKSSDASESSVAISMALPLQEQGRHQEAFELLKRYGDFKQALQTLLKGRQYLKAIYEARLFETIPPEEAEDYLLTVVEKDLSAYCDVLETNLNFDKDLFEGHKQRLFELREKRIIQRENFDADEADLLSDTTSMRSSRFSNNSRGTGKSSRSSKNRRKHERKLLSLKPGNPFEDIALIDALHNHITKVTAQQSHMRDTCKALLELKMDVEAAKLQSQYKYLLTEMQASLDEIWIPELATGVCIEKITGPTLDYTQLQNEQRYALLNPLKRIKPILYLIDWEHEILY